LNNARVVRPLLQEKPLNSRIQRHFAFAVCVAGLSALPASAQFDMGMPNTVVVHFDKTLLVSRSTPTLQVVVNPMIAKRSSIHDGTFAALKELGADYVRYVPWNPYPKLSVAELEPPKDGKTSWDFSLIDPYTKDFLAATEGHSTVMNFSTIPTWMFKTDKPVTYPSDPNQVVWNYTQGVEPVDPTNKQIGEYIGRLVAWYTNGGFTDELGKEHKSGYHYKFPYWEVLNEPDIEHGTTPEMYTARYDAIVEAVHKVSPDTKFVGLGLAFATGNPKYYEYFLNPKNHKLGIPLDYISYHFYAQPDMTENLEDWQYTFFNQADQFLAGIRFINSIRDRLSPSTKTDTDELGVILPTDIAEIMSAMENPNSKGALPDHIPHAYWNAAGALYGYLFIEESRLGVDVIGESQLVGYPSQFPSVSMMNYNTGKPNARYWVLKLIKDNFHSGDTLVATTAGSGASIDAQAYITPQGKKILLVNKRNTPVEVTLPAEAKSASVSTVDEATGDIAARVSQQFGVKLPLAPYAVSVVSWQ
jgi:hypothetical protein